MYLYILIVIRYEELFKYFYIIFYSVERDKRKYMNIFLSLRERMYKEIYDYAINVT